MTSARTTRSKALPIQLLVLLNVLDTVLTLVIIGLKYGTESNPIMETLLRQGPAAFALGKMTLVTVGALALWKGRDSSWALPAIVFCVIVYLFVVAYEMAMIGAILLAGG